MQELVIQEESDWVFEVSSLKQKKHKSNMP